MSTSRTNQQMSIRFPPDLYEVIAALAEENERSLNGQVVWMLRQAVREERDRRRASGKP